MNNQEILDGNKLIAEFLGFEFKNGITQNEVFYTLEKEHPIYLQGYSYKCAKFHSSWDWLMPVVHKCYKLQYGKGWSKSNCLQYCMSSDYFMVENAIELVYKEVIEYIKWYNKNKEL